MSNNRGGEKKHRHKTTGPPELDRGKNTVSMPTFDAHPGQLDGKGSLGPPEHFDQPTELQGAMGEGEL